MSKIQQVILGANLSSTSGFKAAIGQATESYLKLTCYEVFYQGRDAGGVIGERLVMVVYNLGKSANPRQKAVGTEILRLAFQLGIDAHRIMKLF